jgi:Holliday junction resolvase RusA-like endonuclease
VQQGVGMMTMIIRIDDIHIKPYVRMTRRGKFVNPSAKEYLASKENLSLRIKVAMMENYDTMIPAKIPVKVIMKIGVDTSLGHRCDLDNLVKAVLDACNGIAFYDDRWVDEIWASRTIGDEYLQLLIEEWKGESPSQKIGKIKPLIYTTQDLIDEGWHDGNLHTETKESEE